MFSLRVSILNDKKICTLGKLTKENCLICRLSLMQIFVQVLVLLKFYFTSSFLQRDASGRIYVYEMVGITNDPEAGKFWLIYTENEGNDKLIHHNKSERNSNPVFHLV